MTTCQLFALANSNIMHIPVARNNIVIFKN